MGVFKKLRDNWRDMPLEKKIGTVIDAVCGVGSAFAGITVSNKLTEGKSLPERICVRTVVSGLSLAASEVSSAALKREYAEPAASVINSLKEKAAAAREKAAKQKEASVNE